ncbi:MAG: hypothetical protein HUK20_15740 [Fibrobacter sp.]|nr:hypothetical protein [Fibrobacter sp.]
MDENSEIFRELIVFFSDAAKIPMMTADLQKFLGRKRLYRIIRLTGQSFKDCVYQLVDDFPEAMESAGMLRYYKSPTAKIQWEEIEKAETALGNELSMNAYDWAPDAWTAFAPAETSSESKQYELVALIAFYIDE